MSTFVCRIQNRDGSTDSLALEGAADVAAATAAARSALLVSLTGVLMELWCDGAQVATMNREVAQFRRRATPFPAAGWTEARHAAE